MDKSQQTSDVIIDINRYRDGAIQDYEMIASVCAYYDLVKNETLTQADLKFLKYISSVIGIPHYFDFLSNFTEDTSINDIDLGTFSSFIYDSTLHTSEDTKIHKYQKEILNKFTTNQLNRYFLSASTSFGKTHITYEIIKKMGYKNIVLIFPTIALLSENLEKILTDKNYEYFKSEYALHTLSDVTDFGEKNIFIYTPERFLSFIEKQHSSFKHNFDFIFIDEVYKIDNEYIIDEQTKENERDVSYRIAAFYALLRRIDILLAGPYIESYNPSFKRFLHDNEFKILDYNKHEIVNKTYHNIKTKKHELLDDVLTFDFESNGKGDRLRHIVKRINNIGENCIVYCSGQGGAESYARKLIKLGPLTKDYMIYNDFLNHIEKEYHPKWGLLKALKYGIGIHHGSVPKYIQKEIIDLFNNGHLKVLLSTTTITEGVNTSAKNLIVMHSKKGDKPLKKFDAKNIAGRAGRFLHHYSERVIVLQNKFADVINQEDEEIKHKNYDIESPKDEVDLFYTKDEFLIDEDIARKVKVEAEQEARGIPEEVFDQYKIISRSDKIIVYDGIKALSPHQRMEIDALIRKLNYHDLIVDWKGLQLVLDIVRPIVNNQKIEFLINTKCLDGTSPNSLLTNAIIRYLENGFKGQMNYYINDCNEKVDVAINKTAKFVYNTLKYQTVKYLGVFSIMYKFCISQEEDIAMDDVPSIDRLLSKLEYNALTEKGKKASDYGVPLNVLKYYENDDNAISIKSRFDSYERS
ncbi:MAG: DEAD/DEAH box helicase family protein, partial [Candidatus Pacebacteria bacterium]|nr:DEAD/DEAH box helicase family protein [Candidatus Paceibacterota bacterium]